jgi:hypothetical protein
MGVGNSEVPVYTKKLTRRFEHPSAVRPGLVHLTCFTITAASHDDRAGVVVVVILRAMVVKTAGRWWQWLWVV